MSENAIPTTQQENVQFENALRDIENGGKSVKKGFQVAMRCAVKAILYRQDTMPANLLFNKLSGMESTHYKKLMQKNFAAYCGYFKVELDTKGQNRFYSMSGKETPIIFSKEKGKKGWRIAGKIPAVCKENYEKYLSATHFAALKIEEKIEKKSFAQRLENMAKEIIDHARVAYAAQTDAVWNEIAPEYQAILVHVSKIAEAIDKIAETE